MTSFALLWHEVNFKLADVLSQGLVYVRARRVFRFDVMDFTPTVPTELESSLHCLFSLLEGIFKKRKLSKICWVKTPMVIFTRRSKQLIEVIQNVFILFRFLFLFWLNIKYSIKSHNGRLTRKM